MALALPKIGTPSNVIISRFIFIQISFPFHRHQVFLCHLLRKSFFSILADILDAGRPVAIEQESENSAYEVVMNLALLHVLDAFGTSVKAFLLATLTDFAPRCFLILLASWAFTIEELLACSAIKPTGGYMLGIGRHFFHCITIFWSWMSQTNRDEQDGFTLLVSVSPTSISQGLSSPSFPSM